MKKSSEYRKHAQECRRLASQMQEPPQRTQLLLMAEHWDQLAADRDRLIEKHPELATAANQDATAISDWSSVPA